MAIIASSPTRYHPNTFRKKDTRKDFDTRKVFSLVCLMLLSVQIVTHVFVSRERMLFTDSTNSDTTDTEHLKSQVLVAATAYQQEATSALLSTDSSDSIARNAALVAQNISGITITHTPRYDLLGSFVAPSINLYAVALHYNWTLVILPFAGSEQERILIRQFALGDKVDPSWGSGFQDANRRKDYDPAHLNNVVHNVLGFFPQPKDDNFPWIHAPNLQKPGSPGLATTCQGGVRGVSECYIQLPDDPHSIQRYMEHTGGLDLFYSSLVRKHMRDSFLSKNRQRLSHYQEEDDDSMYTIAIHVRRGDILDPARWIDQFVYARVAGRICQAHQDKTTHVHVFSSGPNRDGNWNSLQNLKKTYNCTSVSFHFDELEFDTWAHMVVADALIMSKSSFSEIPALLSRGDVYFPKGYWHPRLAHWNVFDVQNGDLV